MEKDLDRVTEYINLYQIITDQTIIKIMPTIKRETKKLVEDAINANQKNN